MRILLQDLLDILSDHFKQSASKISVSLNLNTIKTLICNSDTTHNLEMSVFNEKPSIPTTAVNPSTSKAQQFLPCKVCGERAGKHSYYGGQVREV